jgi:hypothetical protein
MARFMVLYNSPASAAEMMANATPEEAQAGMDEWMAWSQRNGDSVVDLGMPLGPSMRVTPDSAEAGSTQASGYSFVEAGSLDEAATMVKDHPHLKTPGGTIDVLEILSMPGM